MTLTRTLCLAAVVALPQVTSAASPIPPSALGGVEATVDFCARVDSKSADQYKEWGKRVAGEMSAKELADARNSSEYKASYSALTSQLENAPQRKAAEGCRAALKEASQ